MEQIKKFTIRKFFSAYIVRPLKVSLLSIDNDIYFSAKIAEEVNINNPTSTKFPLKIAFLKIIE